MRKVGKVRKWLAFALAAGLMVSAMSVFAGGGYNYTSLPSSSSSSSSSSCFNPDDVNYSKGGLYDPDWEEYLGIYPPSDVEEGAVWVDMTEGSYLEAPEYTLSGGQWVILDCSGNVLEVYNGRFGPSGSSSSKSDDGPQPLGDLEIIQIHQRAEAEAVQHAASEEGFADVGDMYMAAEKNMSAGEFYNNAVISTPGIENAITVGQGGNLVVDGQVTNMSATISKVTNRAYVDSVRTQQEGRVLNVVDVSYPAVNATINFYMPGVTGEENIVALQYNAGTWVNIEVAEVRADHVTLNMKGNGVVAFIAQ